MLGTRLWALAAVVMARARVQAVSTQITRRHVGVWCAITSAPRLRVGVPVGFIAEVGYATTDATALLFGSVIDSASADLSVQPIVPDRPLGAGSSVTVWGRLLTPTSYIARGDVDQGVATESKSGIAMRSPGRVGLRTHGDAVDFEYLLVVEACPFP